MHQTATSTANLFIIYSSTVMILFLLFVQNLKGHRLNTTVIKYVHAVTGVECVLLCLNEDTSCRSTNFRKTASNSDKNCELLREVHAEKPDLLLEDVQFDHYQLLDPNRVSMNRSCIYKKKISYSRSVRDCGANSTSQARLSTSASLPNTLQQRCRLVT